MMRQNWKWKVLLFSVACVLCTRIMAQGADGFEQLTLKIATGAKGVLPLEPLPFTITLSNATPNPVRGHTAIAPGRGFLEIYVATGKRPFERFGDTSWGAGSGEVTERQLKPGELHAVSGYLYYAHAARPSREKGRYLLPSPGIYRIKAVLKDKSGKEQIESNILAVEAKTPTGDDINAYKFLKGLQQNTDKGGRLRYPAFLMYGRYQKMIEKKEEFLAAFPNSRYSRYVCYSLGNAYAYTYRRGEKVKRGMLLLEKAGSYDDFFLAPVALQVLVKTCLKQKDLNKAKKHLATLKRRFAGSPSAHVAAVQVPVRTHAIRRHERMGGRHARQDQNRTGVADLQRRRDQSAEEPQSQGQLPRLHSHTQAACLPRRNRAPLGLALPPGQHCDALQEDAQVGSEDRKVRRRQAG